MSAWTRPEIPSDFPWPKRCSRSAGETETMTAKKVTAEANMSSIESASELSRATESVAVQAHAFSPMRHNATSIDA